ncbi:MAG: DUF4838 domain-containing protein [Oscillospiraceae bacterium]|nr:DUF4838 domain-containing protein [Oscillospiraceae bacterium]
MFKINKLRDDETIAFAADELKKYLWMMMPDTDDISISLTPDAKDGFRLGLLEDFGLDSEAKDPVWDDVVHIDTTETGGILAGSNPRSVLFAVYRFLKLNGCRWLFPGLDGEYISRQPITAQKYHKLADHCIRGFMVEGTPGAEHVLDYIDYHAKQEMNLFSPDDIKIYMRRYYEHQNNTMNRHMEPLPTEQYNQWWAMFEAEALKRGLLLKKGGHSRIPAAIGLDPFAYEEYRSGKKPVPEEARQYLALINGERKLYSYNGGGSIFFTNLCLSNPEARRLFVKSTADHLEKNPRLCMNTVGFADGHHNHCECEECRKLHPADFQIMIANELDEELTRRGIKTKVALSTYVDLMFPPIREKIKNPDRFFIQFAPISRSYTSSITEDTVIPEPLQYKARNVWDAPKGIEECVALLQARRAQVNVPCYAYEYHFWRPQMRDPALMAISRRLYEDVRSLKLLDIQGYQQDGSNRHFFPHGFHHFIHAETLVNRECDYEEMKADYFSHLYGEDWKQVVQYLQGISDAFGEKYMHGEDSIDPARGTHYNPARAKELMKVEELSAVARELADTHREMPHRVQSLAYRLLERHAEYCQKLAPVFIAKCQGYDKRAVELMDAFIADFGRHDYELERWLDFGLATRMLRVAAKQMPEIEF